MLKLTLKSIAANKARFLLTGVAGLLYWTAAWLAPPEAAWTAVVILMGLVGLPAFALGHVADRERRARAEVERLNEELKGTLSQLQAAQQELVVAERMATVGRLSLKVAHEVRNPIAAIGLNAEMLGDIMTGRPAREMEEAGSLLAAIREQVTALDALTEEYLAFARFPKPHFEEESINHLLEELASSFGNAATSRSRASRAPTSRRSRWAGSCASWPSSSARSPRGKGSRSASRSTRTCR